MAFYGKQTSKYVGLEIIRALAALLVVYNHVFNFGLVPKFGFLWLPTQLATEAVIVFFVLSGTVITLSAERRSALQLTRSETLLGYLQARLLRIYPIYLLGLVLAAIDQIWIDGSWMTGREFFGNAVFLGAGFVVPTPRYNAPLWSLSNEVFYYLLFAVSFYFARFIILWAAMAVLCAVFLYPPRLGGGVPAHLIFVLGLSLPWIMGHWIAAKRNELPRISVPLGFCFFVIGLAFARVPLTSTYFDVFRLTAFGACCCPLILSLIQTHSENEDRPQYRGWRVSVSLTGIAMLWAFSPSIFLVKISLTALSLIFAVLSIEHVQAGLACFHRLVRPLTYVGSISYALYVLHAPLLLGINHMLAEAHSTVRLAVFVAAALALSHIMEQVIQPRLAPRRPPPSRQAKLEST
jgi:peptidoglycan/LPS O-acetylase OafA/YrhL